MKILYISDYAAHECIAEGKMPSHHLFGMAGLINRYISKTSAVIKAEYGGGTIDFLTLSRPSKKEILCLYLRIWGGIMMSFMTCLMLSQNILQYSINTICSDQDWLPSYIILHLEDI